MDQLQGKRKTKGNPFALLAEEGDEAAATSVYRKDTKKKTRSKRQQDKLLKPGGDNEEQRSNPAAIKDLGEKRWLCRLDQHRLAVKSLRVITLALAVFLAWLSS